MFGILCSNKAQFNRRVFYAIFKLLNQSDEFYSEKVEEMIRECVSRGLLILENEQFEPSYSEIASKFNATFKFTPLTRSERTVVTDNQILSNIRRLQVQALSASIGETDIESFNAGQIRTVLKKIWSEQVKLLKTKRERDFIESCATLYDDIVRDR